MKRENVLESIITYAKQRFGFLESNPILKAAQVLDPVNWPDFDVQPADYGVEEIDVLSKHFNSFLSRYDFDAAQAQDEWTDLKVFAVRRVPTKDFNVLWARLHMQHSERFPNICMLGGVVQCLPMNTACCERAFSHMKQIKSDWRSRLGPSTLSMLLRICLEGKNLDQYQPERDVAHWWSKGDRARRPNQIPSGPRE